MTHKLDDDDECCTTVLRAVIALYRDYAIMLFHIVV